LLFAKRTVREAGLIVGLAVVLGLASNARLVVRFLKGDLEGGFLSAKAYPGIVHIGLAEAEDLFTSGNAVFVDARPAYEFRSGHVPGARNEPFAAADETSLSSLASILGTGREIVVYCSGGDCLSSLGLARLLTARGVKTVRVFQGGWAEWRAAGLPAEEGE
jgi:rhodanese-related sulfurtransferase